jgi:hypothetical protein
MRTPPDMLQDPIHAAPRYLDVISSCMSLVRPRVTSRANGLSQLRLRLRARNGTIFMCRFAPRTWFLTFLAYQLAKLPADLVRHGHSPWNRLAGFAAGLRAAWSGNFPLSYLPTRSVKTRSPQSTHKVKGEGSRLPLTL